MINLLDPTVQRQECPGSSGEHQVKSTQGIYVCRERKFGVKKFGCTQCQLEPVCNA